MPRSWPCAPPAPGWGNERLIGTSLFVSLEPCAMCAAAVSLARVARLVFAADDAKGGAVLHGPRFFEQATPAIIVRRWDGPAIRCRRAKC